MNGNTGLYIVLFVVSISLLYFFAIVMKYYYISTICREWNAKLYQYQKHLTSEKDLKEEDKNYRYLEKMYLYPDELAIIIFGNWKESDLVLDKFTLHSVNAYIKTLKP
jgi:hypothetical protein